MDKYQEANRKNWDDRVPIHYNSEFYNVARFRRTRCSLGKLEQEELGEVRGRSLLHLQCHFGMDSLSWAEKGARVTGIDFSGDAIEQARALATELSIPATFHQCNVYDVPRVVEARFDIVFTSYGVLCWLPDLGEWAQIVAEMMRPGGVFLIVDGHPAADMLDPGPEGALVVRRDYFHEGPQRNDEGATYTGSEPLAHAEQYEWSHGIGQIVSCIAATGLRIEHLHEFGFGMFGRFPGMEKRPGGGWWLPVGQPKVPQLFSLKAHKPDPAGNPTS